MLSLDEMVSSNERQSKIKEASLLLKCGSLDNILGLLFTGSLGNSVQQCSSPFCRGGIRYRKRPPTVRNMRAVLKKASWGTRCRTGSHTREPIKRGRLKCTPGSAAAATCLCERTRYQKQASTVRNMRAVLKKASWGTRRIIRSNRCKKQASGVRNRYSVRRTGSSGTVGFEK